MIVRKLEDVQGTERDVIIDRFAQVSSDNAMSELEAAGLAYGRLNQIEDVSQHPHVRRVPLSTPGGDIQMIAPPAIFNGEKAPKFGAVPARDAHSEALRKEFGDFSRQRPLG